MKIRNLICFFFSASLMIILTSCGSDSTGLSPGTYCFKYNESRATAIVELELKSDGTVSGIQQNILLDGSGEIGNINHIHFTGTLQTDTLNLSLVKDVSGNVRTEKETWMLSDTLLSTPRLPLSKIDCDSKLWEPLPTSIQLQGRWQNEKNAKQFVAFNLSTYTDESEERIGGKYNIEYNIAESCESRLSSSGKFIILNDGVCIEVNNLSEEKLTLTRPGAEPATYKKVSD